MSQQSRKQSQPRPQSSRGGLPRTVHAQPFHRGTANGRQAANLTRVPIDLEMILPAILTRMKEPHFCCQALVRTREIVALEHVTGATGEGQVGGVVRSL